jgi:hypothetical protein
MTTISEYLEAVLADQVLPDDSQEMKDLRAHRDEVEAVLREAFSDAKPTIRYGGSKAKGTLIRESYDLDLVCYFPNGENAAGTTLKEIFENVRDELAQHYSVDPKTSALRLHSLESGRADFHIDVVPGRYTDDSKSDCYLYQNGADKERLKTNLDVHISHIKGAGVTPALRLLKLWRVRQGLFNIKNFVWELLCIELLATTKSAKLEDQLLHVLREVSESSEAIAVEDPANPQGNDVMTFLKSVWPQLQYASTYTLSTIENQGWEAVFGKVEAASKAQKVSSLTAAAQVASSPTRPWRR